MLISHRKIGLRENLIKVVSSSVHKEITINEGEKLESLSLPSETES